MTGTGQLLVCHGLTRQFGGVVALSELDLEVRRGELLGLIGPNGSGKTTLIRSILRLTPPRSGNIRFRGTELTGLPTHRIVRQGIGCIPEGRRVFPRLSVLENLMVAAHDDRRPLR